MRDWIVLIEVKSVVAFLPGCRKDGKSRVCGGIFRQNVCRVPVCYYGVKNHEDRPRKRFQFSSRLLSCLQWPRILLQFES